MARTISSDADDPISMRVSPTDMVMIASCEVDLLKLNNSRELGSCCGVSTAEDSLNVGRNEATGTMSGIMEST